MCRKVVIPYKWKWVGCFRDDLALVKDSKGMCGFIDKTGKVIIPCQWEKTHMMDGQLLLMLEVCCVVLIKQERLSNNGEVYVTQTS